MHRCISMDLSCLSVLPSGNLVRRVILFLITAYLSPHFHKLRNYCFHWESLHPLQTLHSPLFGLLLFQRLQQGPCLSQKLQTWINSHKHSFRKKSVLLKLKSIVHFSCSYCAGLISKAILPAPVILAKFQTHLWEWWYIIRSSIKQLSSKSIKYAASQWEELNFQSSTAFSLFGQTVRHF